MKLDISFFALEEIVRRIGAPESTWSLDAAKLAPTQLKPVFIETTVTIDQIEFDDRGIPTWQGEQVLLYIKEGGHSLDRLLHNPEDANRYHVVDCKKLSEMREKGRFEQRYVATNETTGRFKCVAVDPLTGASEPEDVIAALKVCRFCLIRLNYRGYSEERVAQKKRLWLAFSLQDFFEEVRPKFKSLPSRKDSDTSRNEYPLNWESISRTCRSAANWICAGCKINLSDKKNLLQTHHIDRDRRNNTPSNLTPLCVLCHKEHHPTMHVELSARIEILRRRNAIA